MKYELSEDEFLMMQFLYGKQISPSEFLEYNPPNKVWLDHMKTSIYIRLEEAKLVAHINEKRADDFNTTFELITLSKEGEELLNNFLKQKQENEERELLTIQKLRIDVGNAKRINATYWWTFGFSVAALLISLVLLILKLRE